MDRDSAQYEIDECFHAIRDLEARIERVAASGWTGLHHALYDAQALIGREIKQFSENHLND